MNLLKRTSGKHISNLNEDQQRIVREAIPQNISEAEPKDVSKKLKENKVMSKFGGKGDKKSVPGLTTASMSDIVFMLLFFFMVTTSMRETENKVIVSPSGSDRGRKSWKGKDLTSYINIGFPYRLTPEDVRNGCTYTAQWTLSRTVDEIRGLHRSRARRDE